MNQLKAPKPPTRGFVTKWGHFACLEVCCYGIDIGANIVRFNQSEHMISTISTNESAPLWSRGERERATGGVLVVGIVVTLYN